MSDVTCDTSVLVPALTPWHPGHDLARTAVDSEVTVVIAHVLAETFSTLTRMPEPFRASPGSVLTALERLGRPTLALSADQVVPTLAAITGAGLSGGATYDALIAACAVEHGLPLLTMDRRATRAYVAVGASVRHLT